MEKRTLGEVVGRVTPARTWCIRLAQVGWECAVWAVGWLEQVRHKRKLARKLVRLRRDNEGVVSVCVCHWCVCVCAVVFNFKAVTSAVSSSCRDSSVCEFISGSAAQARALTCVSVYVLRRVWQLCIRMPAWAATMASPQRGGSTFSGFPTGKCTLAKRGAWKTG